MKGVLVSDTMSHTIHIDNGTKHINILKYGTVISRILCRSFISLFHCYEIFVSMVIYRSVQLYFVPLYQWIEDLFYFKKVCWHRAQGVLPIIFFPLNYAHNYTELCVCM